MHLCTFKKKTYRCMWISYPIICHAEETRKKQSSGFIWLPLHVQHPYTKPQYAVISDTPSPCKGWVSHVFFQNWYAFWSCFGWLWIYPLVIKHGWKIHEIRDHCHVGALSTPTTNIKHWGSSSQIWLQMNNTWNHSPDLVHYIQRLNQYVLEIFRLNRYPCV